MSSVGELVEASFPNVKKNKFEDSWKKKKKVGKS
jgi:hypothetical protein